MPTVQRTVTTTAPPERVLPYLLDFENAVEWDSGTVTCQLLSGDGSPGTVWHNVSKFAGRTVDLDYTLESVTETSFVIVGRNETTTSRDTITVVPDGSGLVGRLPGGVLLHRTGPLAVARRHAPAQQARQRHRPHAQDGPGPGVGGCPGYARSRPSRRAGRVAVPARASSTSTSPAPG